MNKQTERLMKLFEFLKAYQSIKGPVVCHLDQEEWVLDLQAYNLESGNNVQLTDMKKQVLLEISKTEDETLFNKFYDVYVRMKKEPEQLELVYGSVLLTQEEQHVIHHPVLTEVVVLEYQEDKEVFRLKKGEASPELNQTLLGMVENIKEEELIELTKAFQKYATSSLDKLFVRELLTSLEALCDQEWQGSLNACHILYLSKRQLGFKLTIEHILEDIYTRKDMPSFVADIVGLGDAVRKNQRTKESIKKIHLDTNGLDQKVLFTKPANKEQLLVAKHLERNDAVLVQGPPGTGKTHTIANMIGHLLSQGKSVLVTSYQEKALSVVKDQVPKELQDLCISLNGDVEGRKELAESLDAIHNKRASLERSELMRRIMVYEKNRDLCFKTLDKLKNEVKNIKLNEYAPLKIAGKMYKPAEAAKFISQYKESTSWLVGPIRQGTILPLSEDKIKELYTLSNTLTSEEEMICYWEVDEKQLVQPDQFKVWAKKEKAFKKMVVPEWYKYLKKGTLTYTEEDLKNVLAELHLLEQGLKNEEKWAVEALQAGEDDKAKEQWQSLVNTVKEVYQLSLTYADEFLTYNPQILNLEPHIKPLDVYSQINQKLQSAGKLSKMTLLLNPQMKTVIEKSRVGGQIPQTMQEFEVLIHYTVLEEKRQHLKARWERQMVPLGAKTVEELGDQFELGCQKYCEVISRYLDWYKKKWQPFLRKLMDFGIDLTAISELQDFTLETESSIRFIRDQVCSNLKGLLSYQQEVRSLANVKEEKEKLLSAITSYEHYTKSEALVGLKLAIRNLDEDAYTMYLEQIQKAIEKRSIFKEREEALEKLSFAAPHWAELLARYHSEEKLEVPNHIEEAWLCRQLMELLGKRHERTMTVVKKEMNEMEERLIYCTKQLAVDKAWLHKLIQFDTNRSEVQAIEGWKQLVLKIGAGKGRQVEMLKKEARKLMPKCQSAVPVWIMSLAKVAEHFDPRENKFDVVIIDEASQLDMTALIALYLGKQVIIVGDHEQVSPLAVGEKQEEMERLIKTYLSDVPHNYLYSGRFSIYDLAQISGYQPIRLREHFRCVPEIIGYSNNLSYNGEIIPLRESHDEDLKPLTSLYLPDGTECHQINQEEADAIAQQIVTCCKDEKYKGKTFGVISLKGDKQAAYIDSLLQEKIDINTYEKHHILCGGPAHFQGDERDVIWLSMVDSKKSSDYLRLMTYGTDNLYKKRYNVAMSRAKDQVIILHSFDPSTDLKEEDIRKELFEYCQKVAQRNNQEINLSDRELPDFEKHIKEQLEAQGFLVESHDQEGRLLTGLVVSCGNKRVSVICDSEKWQEEVQLEEEMNRQTVLERVGWTFVYVTASHYYQDEPTHLKVLVEQIQEKGLV